MDAAHVVTPGGVHLAYDVIGRPDASPMVLLHALGERGSSWAPVAARLAERFRVVILDLRGHGDSDWPGRYSFQLMCEDVRGTLDELNLPAVTLVGHSMGGVVAYLLAMQHPDRVLRLIVEDVSPPFRRDRALPERPADALEFDWAAVPAIIGQVNAGDRVAWNGLGEIAAPTLVVGGGAQSHIPQNKLQVVAARVPCCKLVTIPAGHNVHRDRPSQFADAVLNWISVG